jgi:hypothetical protein
MLKSHSTILPHANTVHSNTRELTRMHTATRTLSARERAALFVDLSPRAVVSAMAMEDAEISCRALQEFGVGAQHLLVAGVGPIELKARGAERLDDLTMLGFDALDFCTNPTLLNEAIVAFGAEATRDALLQSANDAVCFAGTFAQRRLEITSSMLFEKCVGFCVEANEVLTALPNAISLVGVSADLLLRCGVRRPALVANGYGILHVSDQTKPTTQQLKQLGFTLVA